MGAEIADLGPKREKAQIALFLLLEVRETYPPKGFQPIEVGKDVVGGLPPVSRDGKRRKRIRLLLQTTRKMVDPLLMG